MELMTKIDIPKSSWKIEAGSRILLVGSCFADEIGQKMQKGGFDAMVNPFGTLYNPESIATILSHVISGDRYTAESAELMQDNLGMWHSWMHHSKFSSTDRNVLLESMNKTQADVFDFLRKTDVLVITLGTAIIYRLKSNGMLVANCHKQLDSLFIRERLSVEEIVEKWQQLIEQLQAINPSLKIIFTVSPIRHKRDGFHTNQISKGILLQAVDEIVNPSDSLPTSPRGGVCKMFVGTECMQKQILHSSLFDLHSSLFTLHSSLTYFPSYEIMLDELRDYRFYADDMIHPSAQAVEYIWQRFQDTYFDNKTKDAVAKATKEWLRSQHRTIIQ